MRDETSSHDAMASGSSANKKLRIDNFRIACCMTPLVTSFVPGAACGEQDSRDADIGIVSAQGLVPRMHLLFGNTVSHLALRVL